MQPSLGRLSGTTGGSSQYLTATPQPLTQAPKNNALLSQLPSALAAAASFVPGVGTVAATGLGAIGEAARQRMSGEDFNLGKIGQEAALSAVPFGLGKAAKLLKSGAQAAKTVNVTREGLQAASTAEKATPVVQEATAAAPSLLSRMSSKLEGQARGITPGAKAGSDQLGVQGAAEMNQFLNNVGVRGKNAEAQLGHLEQLHTGWREQLHGLLDKYNRPLGSTDISAVKDRVMANLGEIARLPTKVGETALVDANGKALIKSGAGPDHELVTTYLGKLGEVKDIKGLQKLKNEIDSGVNWARNGTTPDPVAEEVSQAFRRGIVSSIDNVIPESATVNTLLSKSYGAQDFLKNAAKSPKGFGRIFGVPVISGDTAQTIAAKAGQAAGGAAPVANGLLGRLQPAVGYGKALVGQEATRLVAGDTPPPQPTPEMPSPGLSTPGLSTPGIPNSTPEASGTVFTPEMLQQLAVNDLTTTGGKNLDKIATLDKLFGSNSKAAKPVSSAANQQIANATSGLQQLGVLGQELKSNPGAANTNAAASILPGAVGNFARGAAGTQNFNTARNEIVDVLARLRTGAAITKSEEAQYKSMLPTAGDSPETINHKLGIYQQLFHGILQRAQPGSNTADLASQIVAQN